MILLMGIKKFEIFRPDIHCLENLEATVEHDKAAVRVSLVVAL